MRFIKLLINIYISKSLMAYHQLLFAPIPQNPGIGLNQVKSGWARGGGKGFSGKSDGGMVKIAIFVDTTICALKYG